MSRVVNVIALLILLLSVNAQSDNGGLDYLNQYNAFFLNDFTSNNVDCQGRMAVGGDCSLTNYEVGTLVPDCNEYGLVVGSDLTFTDGACTEKIIYAGTAIIESVSDSCSTSQGTLIQFSTVFSQLDSTSNSIANTQVNGQSILTYSALQLSGTATQTYVDVQAETLAIVTSISIDIPENSWIFITVLGTEVSFENLEITYSTSTNLSYVMWNMPQATSLVLSGLSFKGTILAPNAAIQFSNGNIDGSICGSSFTGDGELHYYPYIPPTTCQCPVCPPSISFPPYTVFVEKYVSLNSTDDLGTMAAGADVELAFYEVGTYITGNQTVLVVGNNLNFYSGTINGVAVVAGDATLSSVSGTVYENTPTGIDFSSEFQTLISLANSFSTLATNGIIAFGNGSLVLTAKNAEWNVFTVENGALSEINSWTINAPEGAEVLVNIPGSINSIAGLQMNLVGGVKNTTIILNFYETTSLTITQTSVQGTVLAPVAVVHFTNGNIDGNLICVSVYGDGEVHLSPPESYQPTCPPCNCPPS